MLYAISLAGVPLALTERNQKLYKTTQMQLLDSVVRGQAIVGIDEENVLFLLDI